MFIPLTVRDFLDRGEHSYPDRIAVIDEPDQPAPSMGSLTFTQLAGLARAQAAQLDALAVPVGARVAVISQNSARLLTSMYGIPAYGRVIVPINFRLAPAEIEYIVRHSGAEVVYADPAQADMLPALDVPHKFVLGDDDSLYRTDAEPMPWVDAEESATASIIYTSGTTARPKGVQLTHRNLWLNAVVFGLHASLTDRDVYLHTLPMFHVNGWGMPYGLASLGAQQIVLRQVNGAEILRRVERHGVTFLCGAPAVVDSILEAARNWDGPIPGSGKVRIICGGAPPPSRTVERVITELGWEFCQIYGLSESSPLVTINRMRAEWDELPVAVQAKKLMRAGLPALGVRVKTDIGGEVQVASNLVFEGYWDQPAETAAALRDDAYATGDGGRLDEDGYLVIADRKKDVIISGGENVSSSEVEDALASYPAVREVAVIGIPDDKWGESLLALVVTDGSVVTAEELIAHCRSRLAGYKCPRRIEFVEELPRTTTGKLQKFKLREPYWRGRVRQVN